MEVSPESLFLPDYDDVNLALMHAAVDMTAAELHGVLTALVCMQDGEVDDVLKEILPTDLGKHERQTIKDASNEIYQVSGALLEDENFIYDLLLPTDDVELSQRLQAIAQWCDGFLLMIEHNLEQFTIKESPEITEAIQAVRDIANIDPEDDQSDDVEGDYFQLVEFLRMSVILIYEDARLGSISGGAAAGSVSVATLH